MAKRSCNLSRTELSAAPELILNVGGTPVIAKPREFSSGSLGWYATGKATVMVNGKACEVQVGCNITAIGSKDLPKGE